MQSQMPPINTADGLYQNGNPLTGVRGTVVTAEWLNDAQSAIRSAQGELLSILAAAGIEADGNLYNQLLTSLQKLFDFSKKQDASDNLTALSILVGATNKFPVFTEAGKMSLADLSALAPLLNPTFTGIPKGPTPAAGNNSKQFSTTEFVAAALTAFLPKRGFSDNDFIRIPDVPSGLLIQWGSAITGSSGVTAAFATPFASTPKCCLTTANQTGDTNTTFQGQTTTTIFLQAYNQAGGLIAGTNVRYIAIGVSP